MVQNDIARCFKLKLQEKLHLRQMLRTGNFLLVREINMLQYCYLLHSRVNKVIHFLFLLILITPLTTNNQITDQCHFFANSCLISLRQFYSVWVDWEVGR
jgi:hypothetical protein